MSDDMVSKLRNVTKRVDNTEVKEIPGFSLPYLQRVVNPVTVPGTVGDFGQPWPMLFQSFRCTAYVVAPNNGINFWTMACTDVTGTIRATLSTSGIVANTWSSLLSVPVSQPVLTNMVFPLTFTATGAPGAIYIIPQIIGLRI